MSMWSCSIIEDPFYPKYQSFVLFIRVQLKILGYKLAGYEHFSNL